MKEDIQCSPIELVFGVLLLAPLEMIVLSPSLAISDMSTYAARHRSNPNESIRSIMPLQLPYGGSFRVLQRQDEYFVLSINGLKEKVRLKKGASRGRNPICIIDLRNNFTFHRGTHICDISTNFPNSIFKKTGSESTLYPLSCFCWPISLGETKHRT